MRFRLVHLPLLLCLVGAIRAASAGVGPLVSAPGPWFDWSGWYVGGNVSGDWAHFDFSQSSETRDDFLLEGTTRSPRQTADIPARSTSGVDEITGGGQVGYNWQVRDLVFGVEADGEFRSLRDRFTAEEADRLGSYLTRFVVRREAKNDWLTSIRLRLGFAPCQRLLVYATAGPAVGNVRTIRQHRFFLTQPDGSAMATYPTSSLQSGTDLGWTAGGGFEYGITRTISLALEYRHSEIETDTFPSSNRIFIAHGGTARLVDEQLALKINVHLCRFFK